MFHSAERSYAGRVRLRLVLPAAVATASLWSVACGDDDSTEVGSAASTEAGDSSPDTAPADGTTSTSTTSATTATSTTAETAVDVQVVELAYAGGEVTLGGDQVAVPAGQAVRLEVTSDVAEEVHVHGYELEVPLAAGETTAIELVGDLPGIWEVELHGSGQLLCELEVAG